MAQKSGGRSRGREAEQRQSPRIEILGQLDGFLMTVNTPVRVLDVGSGGFGVEMSQPLTAGEVHECRFELREGVAVILLAKVMHCRPRKGPRASKRYITGFQFFESATPEAESGRALLMERVAATLQGSGSRR